MRGAPKLPKLCAVKFACCPLLSLGVKWMLNGVIAIEIIADLHTHSVACGHAYSTIREMCAMAAKRNLAALGITEHGPAMPGGPHIYYFYSLGLLPGVIEGVRVLYGAETNIMDRDGKLDISDRVLARLDLVAAGFHEDAGMKPGNVDENTRTLVTVIKNPLVDMVVHPCNRYYPVHIEQVVDAAVQNDVILELNNRSFSPMMNGERDGRESSIELGAMVKAKGGRLAINSDAHFDEEVGDLRYAVELAREAGLTSADIINGDYGVLMNYISKRKERKRRHSA